MKDYNEVLKKVSPIVKKYFLLLIKNNVYEIRLPSFIYNTMFVRKLICKYFGHSFVAKPSILEKNKLKRKGNELYVKTRYDNYIQYYCIRCGKHFRTDKTDTNLCITDAKKAMKQRLKKIAS